MLLSNKLQQHKLEILFDVKGWEEIAKNFWRMKLSKRRLIIRRTKS
jgi:hypothetical protein